MIIPQQPEIAYLNPADAQALGATILLRLETLREYTLDIRNRHPDLLHAVAIPDRHLLVFKRLHVYRHAIERPHFVLAPKKYRA